jgi:hypothetical protein
MTNPRFQRLLSLPLCAVLTFTLILVGCDTDGGEPEEEEDPNGESIFRVSGNGVNESAEWNATFATGTDPETGNSGFVVYMYPGEQPAEGSPFVFISRTSERPDEGSYSFGDVSSGDGNSFQSEFGMFGVLSRNQESFEIFYSDSGGALDITSSSGSRVEGNFDLNGTFFIPSAVPEGVDVSISGSFKAPNGAFFAPGDF